MFDFRFDAATGILHIRTEGFWDLAMAQRFAATMLAEASAIRASHGIFAVLTDARDFPVQQTAVGTVLHELAMRGQSMMNGPNATVVRAMLNKLQSTRLLSMSNHRTFTDMDEAAAWIDSEWTSRRAA
ncbi:hypothetical protein ASG29_13975 [Sphingomonas sp. Leaf412]|uniref:hypothetical protein n=1 Tax=Sphingomonas sp. Leaf412 TaxID=1736370 RepID=UPI0006F5EC1C|nr:hypothetical protein [Sphingomonas sp. Leaf412]KQT32802.1 hypothetical protein ASG29_13975 [Sphingomonas sp. Leaf412]